MAPRLGIRREDKNAWERRVPLAPDHVRALVSEGIEVAVQPSPIRAFPEDAYRAAGAEIREDLSDCAVVFAVKEIPPDLLRRGGAYACFAHVIKGQAANMPALRRVLALDCTLMDYEKVTGDDGRRLVFFGRHAGLAGMIDALWALGRRLAAEGTPTAFQGIRPTHEYAGLEEAKEAVRAIARRLEEEPLPRGLVPMAFGFAGYGNVSSGAQEIFDLLPHAEVPPEGLAAAMARPAPPAGLVKCVFREEHMVQPLEAGRPFDLAEYYEHPERYRGDFERYLPHLTVLMNCIYWAPQYPRLVTRALLARLYGAGAGRAPRLRVIGDISCDVEGAVECTLECTDPSNPVYVYRAGEDRIEYGVEGPGPVVLAVDNLPCELPAEASRVFGDALVGLVPGVVRGDFTRDLERLALPAPFARAVIAHHGALAPEFAYLEEFLNRRQGGAS